MAGILVHLRIIISNGSPMSGRFLYSEAGRCYPFRLEKHLLKYSILITSVAEYAYDVPIWMFIMENEGENCS